MLSGGTGIYGDQKSGKSAQKTLITKVNFQASCFSVTLS